MSRTKGIIHDTGSTPLKLGRTDLLVGVCTLYVEGVTVLLTVDQGGANEVEIALRPRDARALAKSLLRAAAQMESES